MVNFRLNIFHQQCLAQNIPCRRVHFHEFILDVHLLLHNLRKKYGSIPDLMDKVADHYFNETPVFAFDECHVLNVSDAMIMKGCMESLFQRGCVVVATSNLDPTSLYASGINRLTFLPFVQTLQSNCVIWTWNPPPISALRRGTGKGGRWGCTWTPTIFPRLFRIFSVLTREFNPPQWWKPSNCPSTEPSTPRSCLCIPKILFMKNRRVRIVWFRISVTRRYML